MYDIWYVWCRVWRLTQPSSLTSALICMILQKSDALLPTVTGAKRKRKIIHIVWYTICVYKYACMYINTPYFFMNTPYVYMHVLHSCLLWHIQKEKMMRGVLHAIYVYKYWYYYTPYRYMNTPYRYMNTDTIIRHVGIWKET